MTKRPFQIIAAAVLAVLVAAAAATANTIDTTITGAGSSFVSPLVAAWTPALGSAYGLTLNYSPIGSGGGIAAITNRTVDFGASDAPLSPDQTTACKGCVQIPWALSATSIAYNVPGAPTHLHLSGKVLAAIFLGTVTKWNDRAIAKLNKGANLPDLKITPVYRSDASGTSYNFTDYLSHVSREFKNRIGTNTQPNFPHGIGGRGSSGLAGVVSRTDGAIGYVDVAYALKFKFKVAKIENSAGKFQLPGMRGIAAAAATITKVPKNGRLSIVNPPKSQSKAYPICTFTYVIVPLKANKAGTLKQFISWAITSGQSYAKPLQFLPLPKTVQAADKTFVRRIHS